MPAARLFFRPRWRQRPTGRLLERIGNQRIEDYEFPLRAVWSSRSGERPTYERGDEFGRRGPCCAAIFHNDETTQLNTYLLTRQQLISAAFTRWDVGQPIRMFGVSVAQEHHGH